MAIAGVESVTAHESPYVQYHDDLYAPEEVREILIKFANSKNAMRRDMTVEQIVDEFMESDGE